MMHSRLRPGMSWRVLAPILVVAMVALAAFPVPAGAAGEQLEFQGTYGGPGHAEMYASGLEIAPDGSVVVADTGNHQIAKFAADGTPIWRVGVFGNGTDQFDHPRDVGVDSLGNVYVADTGNTRVVKLDPSGGWITSWKGPDVDRMGTPMGITVTNDTVYLADAGKRRIRVFTTSGTQIRSIAGNGSCALSLVRDADADALGNVYVAN